MKTLLRAIWVSLALLSSDVKAQDTDSAVTDTIIIIPDSQTKVLFMGNDMREMSRYTKLDSLKTLLITDIQTAKADESYPDDAVNTYYFIDPSGKRRLKTETSEYSNASIDAEKEKRALKLDLPAHTFHIYDLAAGYETVICVNDPDHLTGLAAVSLDDALKLIASDRKLTRNNFRTDIEKDGIAWNVKTKEGKHFQSIESVPFFGAGLIGSNWSPAIGLDLMFVFNDKRLLPRWKAGASLTGYTFVSIQDEYLSNLSIVTSYDLKVLWNSQAGSAKGKWFGVGGGFYDAPSSSLLHDRYKLSFLGEGLSSFNFSFDIILLGKQRSFYGVTMKFPF